MPSPEELARENIDKLLAACGWEVQDRKSINLIRACAIATDRVASHSEPDTMNGGVLAMRLFNQSCLTALFLCPFALLGGVEAYDAKSVDNSKESPPVEKSWCESPAPLEIRIGIPGWISRLESDFGVKGLVAPLDIRTHMNARLILLLTLSR
jgi:hypothetical protein